MADSHGQCLCGAIIFEIVGEPDNCMQCFCDHCQKNAGAPFQLVSKQRSVLSFLILLFTCLLTLTDLSRQNQCAKFKKAQVTVKAGQDLLQMYIIKGTLSGSDKHKIFCSRCGCTMWTIPQRHGGDHLIIRTAVIEDGCYALPSNLIARMLRLTNSSFFQVSEISSQGGLVCESIPRYTGGTTSPKGFCYYARILNSGRRSSHVVWRRIFTK